MRRPAILAALLVLVLVVGTQFALPPLAENRAQERLTRDGGSAKVEIEAIPALRLLLKDGDLLRVRARGIELPIADLDERVFSDLDGFGEVDVQVTGASAGPFRFDSVSLTRSGNEPYRTAVHGSVSGRDLGTFAGSVMGGLFGGLLGGVAGGMLPFGDEQVPIDLEGTLRSDDGRARAVVVHGSVAGVPAGPLVEVLAQALAGSL